MNLDDLWIGDEIQIISSKKIGTFEGINKGKVRVKINEKNIHVGVSNIRLVTEKKREINIEINSDPKPSFIERKMHFNNTIDLHIEKLQESKKNDRAEAILEFQLRKLSEFIEEAIELRCDKAHIIHGKGTGALRMETMNIINNFSEIKSIYPINNDGGITIYLRYD